MFFKQVTKVVRFRTTDSRRKIVPEKTINVPGVRVRIGGVKSKLVKVVTVLNKAKNGVSHPWRVEVASRVGSEEGNLDSACQNV